MGVMFKERIFNIHTNNCDIKGALRASATLDFFQDLAGTHASEIGVGYENITALGYIWVVMYEQFEIVSRFPKFGESVIVRTWPKPRGRLEFEREYEICDQNNTLLIRGIANWTLMDVKRRCIAKGSDVVFIGDYYDRTNYTDKQKRRLNLVDDTYDFEYSHKVCLSDLDRNLHMNNSKYLDILYNMQKLEAYKSAKKVEIAFLHEARLNDEIKVRHFKDGTKDCYKGYVNDEVCFEAILYLDPTINKSSIK